MNPPHPDRKHTSWDKMSNEARATMRARFESRARVLDHQATQTHRTDLSRARLRDEASWFRAVIAALPRRGSE